MEIKGSWDKNYSHTITFRGLDVNVMAAAARERICSHNQENEIGEITDDDLLISKWDLKRRSRIYKTSDLETLAAQLQRYSDCTDPALKIIDELEHSSETLGAHVARRVELGRHAMKLVEQMRDKIVKQEMRDFEGPPQVIIEQSRETDG
jgi:hypothetical protein